MNAPPAVEFIQYNFSYNGAPILTDVSLAVTRGDYVAIIGPNGVGKSTLLKSLIRIITGGSGEIRINGRALASYTQKELGRVLGYVSQSREHFFPYTVREFVSMGRYPYQTPLSRLGREDEQIIDEVLALTGLTRYAARAVQTLSGGERQKVQIAGALAQRPQILLLDEPTTHLDPKYHVEVQETISRISRDAGITVLHVTHDLNHIQFWSQQVIALKEGKVHFHGTPDEVLTAANLQSVFDVGFLLVDDPHSAKKLIVARIGA